MRNRCSGDGKMPFVFSLSRDSRNNETSPEELPLGATRRGRADFLAPVRSPQAGWGAVQTTMDTSRRLT